MHLLTHLNRLPAPLAVLMALQFLGGCTTMTPNECRSADWGGVGLRDGLSGEPLSVLDARVKDCAEAGVRVGTTQYLQGRTVGLQTYCELPNAVRLGLDGKPYRGVCPAVVDPEFRRRHALGSEVHNARSNLQTLEGQRRNLEKKLDEAATDDERRKARDELAFLDRNLRRGRDRLRDAEWALDRLR